MCFPDRRVLSKSTSQCCDFRYSTLRVFHWFDQRGCFSWRSFSRISECSPRSCAPVVSLLSARRLPFAKATRRARHSLCLVRSQTPRTRAQRGFLSRPSGNSEINPPQQHFLSKNTSLSLRALAYKTNIFQIWGNESLIPPLLPQDSTYNPNNEYKTTRILTNCHVTIELSHIGIKNIFNALILLCETKARKKAKRTSVWKKNL